MNKSILENANIEWRDGNPFSLQFNDIYFSKTNGSDESLHTYIDGNNLRNRWQCQKANWFRVAELGFGTGLNFLSTAYHWAQNSQPEHWLEYYSIEKYPLTLDDLKQAQDKWPEFANISQWLSQHYPLPFEGIWQIDFPKQRVRLILLWMDIEEGLGHLNNHRKKIDAWYLDGFAPQNNPLLWQKTVFSQIAQCSHSSTTLATFTVAGLVKRSLIAEGFDIQKRPGFGTKREMLTGIKVNKSQPPQNNPFKKRAATPWLTQSNQNPPVKSVGVIGAGIAGATTARYLAEAGLNVTIFDKQPHAGAEASGNSAGIYYPFLSSDINLTSRFFLQAYHQLLHDLERFELSDFVNTCGVLKLCDSKEEASKLLNSFKGIPEFSRWMHLASPEFVEKKFSAIKNRHGIYFPKSGYLQPKQLCQKIIEHHLIQHEFNSEVFKIEYQDNEWFCQTHNEQTFRFDALVICNSHYANTVLPDSFLPAIKVRGQTTQLNVNDMGLSLPQSVVCDDVYLIPYKDHQLHVGATFEQDNLATELQNNSQVELDGKFFRLIGQPSQKRNTLTGRVGFRYCSVDRLPMVGPLPIMERFLENYQELWKGKPANQFPRGEYWPNLYLNIAHGARGITSSFLSAKLISQYMTQDDPSIPSKIIEQIHPSRFLIRELKKTLNKRLPGVQNITKLK